jgi:phage terminase large subunit
VANLYATNSFQIIGEMNHKNKVVQGSQGAGKTFGILLIWILQALESTEENFCSIVTATFPALRNGALKDFFTIMKMIDEPLVGTKSPAQYKVGLWTFEFFSIDKENKGLGARRDRLFINEANRISWKIARQLINRTHKERIFDFNPVKEFWAHTHFVNVGDCDFVKLTYKDNEKLPEAEIESIEKYSPKGLTPDPNFWRVYGLGEIGFSEGIIFTFETFSHYPQDVDFREMYGIDFGWQDPLACVKVSFDKKNKVLYLEEIFYKSQAYLEELADSMKEKGYKSTRAVCDNDPLNIRLLRRLGIKSVGIGKKAKLETDIKTLKQYKILVHETSHNLISELTDYSYKSIETPNGTMFEPYPANDQQDHLIDAFRYPARLLVSK